MKQARILIFLALVLGLAAPVQAQQRPMGPPPVDQGDEEFFADPGRDGSPPNERRQEVLKKIEAVRIWRLTEALQLDEKTAAKFIPAISALDRSRRELMQTNYEIKREIRAALEAEKPDERKLKTALDKLRQNHREMMSLQDKELEAAKNHLTIEQQARYVLFQQDFRREMRGMIGQARGGGPGMGGMRGGPGRGGMGPGQGYGPGPDRPR